MTSTCIAKILGIAAVAVSTLTLLGPGRVSAGKLPPVKSSPQGSPIKAPLKSNGSGIAVRYRIDGTPEVGVAVPVVLTFDGVTDPTGGSLSLATEGGTSLGAALATRSLPSGQVTTTTVDVAPAAAGIAYLHVFTTQYGATSATSIPVQVGRVPLAMPSTGELKQDAAGDKIRSMQVK